MVGLSWGSLGLQGRWIGALWSALSPLFASTPLLLLLQQLLLLLSHYDLTLMLTVFLSFQYFANAVTIVSIILKRGAAGQTHSRAA